MGRALPLDPRRDDASKRTALRRCRARAQDRPFASIEQALLLRALKTKQVSGVAKIALRNKDVVSLADAALPDRLLDEPVRGSKR